jgi:hypothetical protein
MWDSDDCSTKEDKEWLSWVTPYLGSRFTLIKNTNKVKVRKRKFMITYHESNLSSESARGPGKPGSLCLTVTLEGMMYVNEPLYITLMDTKKAFNNG